MTDMSMLTVRLFGDGAYRYSFLPPPSPLLLSSPSPPPSPQQVFDPPDKVEEKAAVLCDLLSSSQHVVVHTGAGVSTAAGTGGVPTALHRNDIIVK